MIFEYGSDPEPAARRKEMIEWTKEAIEAASEKWWAGFAEGTESCEADMRAALDAAVKAQGIDPPDLPTLCAFEAGKDYGRAEALEEVKFSTFTMPEIIEIGKAILPHLSTETTSQIGAIGFDVSMAVQKILRDRNAAIRARSKE